eukprot:CAMPEP_0114543584 /NCGR_PEP_ID=MMETSP0114-20121206/2430_1 /TAXON_ID=31324 /ORGANISM="Goniomonas sp, Strain m" /LENGTH=370 /DNA_ID=CAMNT_0001727925 /DNA_START=218 /DNA_END=1332 /DNA_ORIENTATION=+
MPSSEARGVDGGLEAMSQDERNIFAQQFNSIFFSRGSTRAALLAAGSTAELCHRICDGTLDRGFAVVRPPGHHCEINQPMGFCLFNNVAIACHTAIRAGLKRILIVDWDVHHGNGTQAMFKDREDVLFISIHRGRFYPGQDTAESHYVGEGKGAGFTVNVPWPSGGYGDADYELVWSLVVLPLARQFDPELVLVSAGFDAAAGDPLGGCKLSPDGYGRLTRGLLTVANGKMLQVLEGGYNLQVIPLCAEACVANMLQSRLESDKEDCAAAWWDTEEPGKDAQPGALETVAEVIAATNPTGPACQGQKSHCLTDGSLCRGDKQPPSSLMDTQKLMRTAGSEPLTSNSTCPSPPSLVADVRSCSSVNDNVAR